LPGGFPWEHPRFWINRVLPWIVVAVSGTGLVGVWRKNSLLRQSATVFIVADWTSALVASTITYPNGRNLPQSPQHRTGARGRVGFL
jgi:hypothetical protein